MKVKSWLVLVALMACWALARPVGAAGNLSMTPTQGTVGAEVTIPSTCNYGTGSYYLYWGDSDQLLAQGVIEQSCASLTFTVPEAPRGKHTVTFRVGTEVATGEFNVLASISLASDKGAADSDLTVKGTGFNINEAGITVKYDGTAVATGIVASGKGSWQSTFKVPNSSRGQHIIDAEGVTPAAEVQDLQFAVTPRISISPESGWVGTVVNVTGTGFGSGETNITVTYEGLASKSGIGADVTGSWQSSFSVPSSTKGIHKVDARGATTPEVDVPEVDFTVAPAIRLELAEAPLGGVVHAGGWLWVMGVGFEGNETGISVTFDGILVASGITADARGSWAARVEVPPSIKGEHSIDALGSTTKAGDIADVVVLISPMIEISPAEGAIGEDIKAVGNGFGANQKITITFDGAQIPTTGSTTDAKGSFNTGFSVPAGKAGDHTITVTDAAASVAVARFTIESAPPPVPGLVSPEAGTRIGFVGKTVVSFEWADVQDPSGVFYVLEVSRSADFAGSVIRKEKLTQSAYTLTREEALPKGAYYWRVKAIDGAGNESQWTNGLLFEVGIIEWWMIPVIVVAAVGVLAIVWRIVSLTRKGGWK